MKLLEKRFPLIIIAIVNIAEMALLKECHSLTLWVLYGVYKAVQNT